MLFLDKNRTFQTRSGTYNTTRFDRLMEDFSYQYTTKKDACQDVDGMLEDLKKELEHDFLAKAVKRFNALGEKGHEVQLNFVDNLHPFSKAFFAEKNKEKQIPLSMLGSGYEMIFTLLYSYYLAQQSKKSLIVLIDEPELHLHPSLQEDLVKILFEFSKTAQVILTTHSPLFVKQVYTRFEGDDEGEDTVKILKRTGENVEIIPLEKLILDYISANEINFVAFGLATDEYYNELYEALKEMHECHGVGKFDKEFFQKQKKAKAEYPPHGDEHGR